MAFWRDEVIQPGMERDTDDAIAEQLALLKTDPQNALAHFALGTLYNFKGDRELAISYFQNAIASDPTYAAPHVSLGRIYVVQGANGLSWRYAREAARLGDRSLLEQLERYPNLK